MVLPLLSRGGGSVARAARAIGATSRVARAPAGRRSMGGGHDRHIGLPGEHVPITDINPIHKNVAYLGMVTMFAWVLIRFKEEGLVLLGFEHPWDHMHDHGHEVKTGEFGFQPGPVGGDEDDDDDDEEAEEEEAEEEEEEEE